MQLRTWYRHPAYDTCFALDVSFTQAKVTFAAHEGGATQVPVLVPDRPVPVELVRWMSARGFHDPEGLLQLVQSTWVSWRAKGITDLDARRALMRRLADTPTEADAYPIGTR